MKSIAVAFVIFMTALPASALFTEVGISYSRKKTSFDANNFFDSESMTGSLSFYFLETVALELSYTSATGVREEKVAAGTPQEQTSTIVQTTKVLGSDLIWALAGKTSMFQPYIKGGVARLERAQEVKVNTLNTYKLEPETALAPSYGIGFKIALTQQFGIKVGYDAWQTPIGGGNFSNDASLKSGITWMF